MAIAGEQGCPSKKPKIDSYVGRQKRWIEVKNHSHPALEGFLDSYGERGQ